MQSVCNLRNEKKIKIIKALMEELEAEKQMVLLTLRLMDQIESKLWSSQGRE
ncbi:MAG TPA: hypothetical protein VN456_18590 [Desulfosporosinus sp.]|nr:hypothetical protein [Desulfosporosinus sp.]